MIQIGLDQSKPRLGVLFFLDLILLTARIFCYNIKFKFKISTNMFAEKKE